MSKGVPPLDISFFPKVQVNFLRGILNPRLKVERSEDVADGECVPRQGGECGYEKLMES